ncbi:MAG: hypothetical protein KDB14_26900 [Planctomycetales bacterium]|nr:hypothetical protein [Planctomycetales bacterium]
MRYPTFCLATLLIGALSGCCAHPPEITAVPASRFNQCEPPGMPFYLPKPLLVVSKNVRHIDEAKVGLTQPAPIPNAFDDQASYGDIKANVTVPGKQGSGSLQAAKLPGTQQAQKFDEDKAYGVPEGWRGAMTPAGRIEDGLSPDSFYTYQIVFIPDLGQKYGLRIKGKPGEVRAAMNLVNGWMYTGMGPYYLKDSSTAQNIMAMGVGALFAGRGAADVLDSVAGLADAGSVPKGGGAGERAVMESDVYVDRVTRLAKVIQSQTLMPREMLNFAEVSIYEPTLTETGGMDWRLIANHSFDRQYFSPDMSQQSAKLIGNLIQGLKATTPAGSPGAEVPSTLDGRPPTGGAPAAAAPTAATPESLAPPTTLAPARPSVNPLPAPMPPPMPAPSGTLPGQPVPGQPVPGQPVPGQPVPGQPVPGQPVPGQPVPGQPVPSQPVPGGQFP